MSNAQASAGVEDEEPNAWMVRDCEMYRDEYRECKSIRSRFHQLFTRGKVLDCEDWKSDYKSCQLWNSKMDQNALKSIVTHEKTRMAKRISSILANDVWEPRSEPPADWNSPLPPPLENLLKTSPLARAYSKEETK